jgi:hypothetical protein
VSLDNILRALSRTTGNQHWKQALPIRAQGGPVRVSETLLLSGLAPVLYGYSVHDGAPAGEIRVEGELAAPPHAVTGTPAPTVALVTRDLAKGAILWAVGRRVEPETIPVAPLPNPVTLTVPGGPAPADPSAVPGAPAGAEPPAAPAPPPGAAPPSTADPPSTPAPPSSAPR